MTENDNTHEQEGGWVAKTAYALFDVENSAVGAMHATFIFAVYFASESPRRMALHIGVILMVRQLW